MFCRLSLILLCSFLKMNFLIKYLKILPYGFVCILYSIYRHKVLYRAGEVLYWQAKVLQNFSRIQSPALEIVRQPIHVFD